MEKICSKCGNLKPLTDFYSRIRNGKKCYRSHCISCVKNARKEKYKEEKEIVLDKKKSYYINNKEKIRSYQTKWNSVNKEKFAEYRRKPENLLRMSLRNRYSVHKALKGGSVSKESLQVLGCTIEAYKHYMESLFTPGMSWSNYGEWEIDHIKPIASFDLTDEKEINKAFHFSNTQPLWFKDNRSKGKKEDFILKTT